MTLTEARRVPYIIYVYIYGLPRQNQAKVANSNSALEAKNNISVIFRAILDFYTNLCNNYSTSTKYHQNWLFIRIKCFNCTFMYFYSIKLFEKYIFLKMDFSPKTWISHFGGFFKIEINSKSYTKCVYKISRSFIKYFWCCVRLMLNMREISLLNFESLLLHYLV